MIRPDMTPFEAFFELFEAALKDAASREKKVTFLQITIDSGDGIPNTVRVVTLPEQPVMLTKAEAESEIHRVMKQGDGFHYTSDGLRIVVMREIGTHKFPDQPPFKLP